LPEVAGDAAIYIDPDDPESLRDAMTLVCEPAHRRATIAAGLQRATSFTWSKAASAFASALSAAAAADTEDQREARGRRWRAPREAQNISQLAVAPSRAPEPNVELPPWRQRGARVLKGTLVRYLPPRAVRVLGAVNNFRRHYVSRLRGALG
jgi:hypothetical protein